MSVLYEFTQDAMGLFHRQLPAAKCVECGDELELPFVYWHCAHPLVFHPECAARLGPHLIADAREATLAAARQPHWRRRLLWAVRNRLVGEEKAVA